VLDCRLCSKLLGFWEKQKWVSAAGIIIKPFILLGLAAEYRSRRWVWSTVIRRPSDIYNTHRRTKLTVPETISRSRDMVGDLQNVNSPHDLTTPLPGMVWHDMIRYTVYLRAFKSWRDLATDVKCTIQILMFWSQQCSDWSSVHHYRACLDRLTRTNSHALYS